MTASNLRLFCSVFLRAWSGTLILLTYYVFLWQPPGAKGAGTNDLPSRPAFQSWIPAPTAKDILSFDEILRLRDSKEPQAVPVLERILTQDLHTSRIHGFAAAQALFSIGTTEAHVALSRQLLTNWPAMSGLSDAPPDWLAGRAIEYTDSWAMREPERSRFIEAYLLKNLSTNLALNLEAQVAVQKGTAAWVHFSFRFENTGKDSVYIPKPDDCALGMMLFFRRASGPFERHIRMPGGHRNIEMIEIAPSDSREFRFRALLITTDQYRRQGFTPESGTTLVLGIDIAEYFLTEGEYEFTAMYEVDRRSDWRQSSSAALSPEALRRQQAWSGRVASKPIRIRWPTLKPQAVQQ